MENLIIKLANLVLQ